MELKCVPTWAFTLLEKDGFDYTKLSYNSIVEKVFDNEVLTQATMPLG